MKSQSTKWEGTDFMDRGSISERNNMNFPNILPLCTMSCCESFILALLNYSRAEFSL
jgi:hypothetical protein